MGKILFAILVGWCPFLFCEMNHFAVHTSEDELVWEHGPLNPFDELIVSWDASRPKEGYYLFSISLLTEEWSPWLPYAYWGKEDQHTFDQENGQVKSFQDTVESIERLATRYRVRIEAREGALLEGVRALHASTTNLEKDGFSKEVTCTSSINIVFKGLSQMALQDERRNRLCSPTSTAAVIRYLQGSDLNPLTFADKVFDSSFDIYGNWIFNTAEASYLLGPSWSVSVTRLQSFDELLESLEKGVPVVVSVKGGLEGGAVSYTSGHLMVVKGYDPKERKVHCMDPAFLEDELTLVNYPLDDFLNAWERRHGLAYLFCRKINKI